MAPSRIAEARAVTDFLTSASTKPSALIVEGEAGIGKTTLWLAAIDQAREQGFLVLTARGAEAETVHSYAALADLLGGVDPSVLADLPDPQRRAVDRVLVRSTAEGEATDPRAVPAAFMSIIERLAAESPLILAVDDLQWLDASSVHVLSFAAPRLSGRVSLLGTVRTVRTGQDARGEVSWLQLPRSDAVTRIRLGPLPLGGLHAVLSERLGRSFPRPAMVRIHEISGGNPFYALELARATDSRTGAPGALPGTLAELVRARIGALSADVDDTLLATACLATPTVEVVARATGTDPSHVTELLEDAEDNGIVEIDGNRLRFTHPLLARGVYTDATPARRRKMHQRLAGIVEQPELHARHLALAATSADPLTLQSLDAAAESARLRGAPEAAAELLDLAIGLGGDTPARRIQLAGHRYNAGDAGGARTLLEETIEALSPGVTRAQALNLLGVIRAAEDNFVEAADLLERALREPCDDIALRAQMLVSLSFAQLNIRQFGAAVVSADDAVAHAERHGQPHLLSQTLSFRIMLGFALGDGIDEPGLARALALEDHDADTPLGVRASVQNALLLGWTGRLERGYEAMTAVRRRCIEHGEEYELILVAFHCVMFAIWRGDFAEATVIAEDAMERALQLNRDYPLATALTMRGTLAAYAGREDQARHDFDETVAAFRRYGSPRTVGWPIAAHGFLEVSLGNYDAALRTLEPLLPTLDAAPDSTEMLWASFVPDLAEALIQRGRLSEAEALIDLFERNGRRVDRPWMLANGGRCRAMLLAARGDLEGASLAAARAMTEHDRLPMPFERARTQLLVGQLQRRRGQKPGNDQKAP